MITVQFTPDLSALQGVLISADYVHSFTNITTKGGNENKIDFVIKTVRTFLRRENYVNDKGIEQNAVDSMRRFALYIVLNSDLPILNELVSTDSTIDLLIWTIPTIAKCLMCEMLWKLSMEKFVYEIIAFSYPQLSFELADALLFNMKYFNPTESLTQLRILSTACFRILCRIFFFAFDEKQLQFGFNNFQKCMVYFCNPPNESKLENIKKDDLYKYYGNCLHTILTILWECFNNFTNDETYGLDKSVAIYEITYKNDCINKVNYKPCQSANKSQLEVLNKCLTDLLDKCMKLVMGINLDIFCAWSEFEEGGSSMQETIGQLCYKVRQGLLNSELSDHPVVTMLEQISRKPTDIQEVINTTDNMLIIENIENKTDESIKWLQALINTDKLVEDITLLQTVETNLSKLSDSDCSRLFSKFYEHVKATSEHDEYIKSLIIKVYQQCSSQVKYGLLDNHFKDGFFNNILECKQFSCKLTEIFNKLAIIPESDLLDVLSLFIQNPHQVYLKIFKSAIENEQQMNIMFKVISLVEKYSSHYYRKDTEPCLTRVLKNAMDEKLEKDIMRNNLIKFISKLKHADIISGPKLLLLVIMPKLHSALVNKSYSDINLQCSLLHTSYTVEDLIEYRAPMLAMLAQVMNQVRWKITTFDILAPTTLSLATELQISLMNTYEGIIPENEVSWLKGRLKELDPLNMYYYRQLWNPPGNTFVEVISGIHIHKDMDTEMLTLWLAQVLCSSTLQEWDSIWNSLEVFGESKVLDFFHNAMLSVLQAERSNRTSTTWACLLYCYKNLVHCIRFKFLKEPLPDNQVLAVTNKLTTVIGSLEENNLEEFGSIVIPLFGYIAQRKADYKLNITQILQSNMLNSKLRAMILNLFSNDNDSS